MAEVLKPGAWVRTPYGFGVVQWARMRGDAIEAYSVALDHKRGRRGYTGSIVKAEHVTPVGGGEA